MRVYLRDIWTIRSTIYVIVTPLALLPLIFVVGTQEAKCGYVLILMSVYWITEAIPLPATALIPVVAFPLLGIMKGSQICSYYMSDASMFGIGGCGVAIAVQKCGLHRRLSLGVMPFFGTDPKWLMMGFMLITWFLSMWVNNTASTAMLIPIVQAVLEQLRSLEEPRSNQLTEPDKIEVDNTAFEMETVDNVENCKNSEEDRVSQITTTPVPTGNVNEYSDKIKLLCKGMTLCIAYAANIGGTATISGTTPNIVLQGQADGVFRRVGLESGVDFVSWMVLALPTSFLCLIAAWVWLVLYFLGWRSFFHCTRFEKERGVVQEAIRKEYRAIGPITFAEIGVIFHLLILIILWLSRTPPEADGWGKLFLKGYISDYLAAIVIMLSLFIFPSKRPQVLCFRRRGDISPRESVPGLLDWSYTEKYMPWGIIVLIGGGLALAGASTESGLSAWMGEQMHVFDGLEPSVLVLVLCVAIALATEVTSNTATITLILPLLAKMAEALQLNPLHLMVPTTLAVSFAFMLPVATPPNALVFSTGHLEVKDMVKAGIVMNILCLAMLQLAVNTWGTAFFKWDVLPVEFTKNLTGTG